MFTGLIGAVGTVKHPASAMHPRITIASQLARELTTGGSIAVSGVCLTALDIRVDEFSADLARETQERTNLTSLPLGASVNLELPARADTPLDGHIVQGHVDGTATLVSLERSAGGDWLLTLELERGLESGVVPKGSITVEGISLTVANLRERNVQIAIIPHTYQVTNLRKLEPRAKVNIELDVLSKYAAKLAARRYRVEELLALGF